ncbi:MAG: hypothetical protein ACKVU1_02910 [bacterium]
MDDAGAPASGLHDFRFRLFDAASGGAQIGSLLCVDNVNVIEGVFTTPLDFGQQYATTAPRHLEIEVRRDTGLTCATATGFIVLGPRQQLTATPIASHANSAFSLDAADGAPANAVFVDNGGKVGIGTTSPAALVHLKGTAPVLVLQDTASPSNQAGYISFRSDTSTETGWLGYGTSGSPQLSLLNNRTGGDLRFYTGTGGNITLTPGTGGDINLTPGSGGDVNLVGGNVGVGTSTPTAKLDVRGDIRLGSTGQYLATSGEENLRIIRGRVDTNGTKVGGSGFTVVKTATGRYTVTFTQAFTEIPTVTATTVWGTNLSDIIAMEQITTTTVLFAVINDVVGGLIDTGFHFTAIGPR